MTTPKDPLRRTTKRDPKTGCFLKGHPGNPSGRIQGANGKKGILEAILSETKSVMINGKTRAITMKELFLLKVKTRAITGNPLDLTLYEQLLDAVLPAMPQGSSGFLIAPEPITDIGEWELAAAKLKNSIPKYPTEDDDDDDYYD